MKEICLLDQAFVKNPDKTIDQIQQELIDVGCYPGAVDGDIGVDGHVAVVEPRRAGDEYPATIDDRARIADRSLER